MLLPTKHLDPDRALLCLGAELLQSLAEPQTVSALWETVRMKAEDTEPTRRITFDWYVLALVALYAMGAVEFADGVLKRTQR